MKNLTKKLLPILLAIALSIGSLTPVMAHDLGDDPTHPLRDLHPLGDEELEWFAEMLGDTWFGEDMLVVLTPEARDLALADLEYLYDRVMQIAPTQNIIGRRQFDSVQYIFAMYHQVIYHMIPIISETAFFMDERWENHPDEAHYIAANYLFTLLLWLAGDIGQIGHMAPQSLYSMEVLFYSVAYLTHRMADYIDTLPWGRMLAHHYDVFSSPSALWFYGLDPFEFDFDEPSGEIDPYNIMAVVIEPNRIAYISVASFANDLAADAEVLFPFFEEIQDFEHLIIDLRGNRGGWANSFPSNFVSMLIDEDIVFMGHEFFIYSEYTAAFFENDDSARHGQLYEIIPVSDFIAQQGLTYFNQDDRALLDYVAVWEERYSPAENNIPFSGEIWMLVDGWSASASESAALIAINGGFATVVGEPTAGITGVNYTFAALPNTGIVFRIDIGYTVDRYGRSIEEFGVIPQVQVGHFDDALLAVIDIIGEAPPSILETIPRMYFVPMRQTAEAHGWIVHWDGYRNAAVLTDTYGYEWVLYTTADYVVSINGVLYISLARALEIFG